MAIEMAQTLRDLGYVVVGPSLRLEDAKAKAKIAEIDVALLDVNLGRGTTSQTVAEILRARNVPLVFITAYDRAQISYIQPHDALIKKPVYTALLQDALAQIFDVSR